MREFNSAHALNFIILFWLLWESNYQGRPTFENTNPPSLATGICDFNVQLPTLIEHYMYRIFLLPLHTLIHFCKIRKLPLQWITPLFLVPVIIDYNLPDLKYVKGGQIALELYQMVEFVQAHVPVYSKQFAAFDLSRTCWRLCHKEF